MINTTTGSGQLKVHYEKYLSDILVSWQEQNKAASLMGILTRKKGAMVKQAAGSAFAVGIKSKRTISANNTFSQAQTNGQSTGSAAARFDTFLVPVVYGAGVGYMSGQAIEVSTGDQNAFVDVIKSETDDALYGVMNEIALNSFRKGTGSRGRISAVDTTSVTLTKVSDLVNFERGMEIVAAAADGTGSLRSATSVTITDINWEDAKMLTSADASGLSWSAGSGGDYLFQKGDFTADTATKIQGLAAWCPTTKPTVSTEPTFMSVARYNEPRLLGTRHNMQDSTDLEQALLDCSAKVSTLAQKQLTHFFGNPYDWATFAGVQEVKRQVMVTNKETGIGFSGIEVRTPWGFIPFLPDRNCPKGLVYGINENHLFLVHAGPELAHVVDDDGNVITRAATADAFEVRVRSMANLACNDPSTLAVIYNVA